jgi:hypothetical protein
VIRHGKIRDKETTRAASDGEEKPEVEVHHYPGYRRGTA